MCRCHDDHHNDVEINLEMKTADDIVQTALHLLDCRPFETALPPPSSTPPPTSSTPPPSTSTQRRLLFGQPAETSSATVGAQRGTTEGPLVTIRAAPRHRSFPPPPGNNVVSMTAVSMCNVDVRSPSNCNRLPLPGRRRQQKHCSDISTL